MSAPTPVHIGAVDLGASSGRVMVGTIANGRVSLTEIRRFSNSVVPVPTSDGERLFWDVLHLWNEVRQGLLTAVRSVGLFRDRHRHLGGDYGLVNASGALSTQVHAYRSTRTRGIPRTGLARIPAQEVYASTGCRCRTSTHCSSSWPRIETTAYLESLTAPTPTPCCSYRIFSPASSPASGSPR